ncbi:MAG: outer membrane beta-barrel protein [Verrucomicrobia bacterium]|nr:outer membrane beta-barrel protein [Verrucomicrobiota bacterium]
MQPNAWTLALAGAGLVSFGALVQAEEAAQQVMTALSQTTLSGYVDTSAIWKFGRGNTPFPGRAFDGTSKMDGFNLNVVKLQLEKPLSEEQWSAGYQVGILFGPDAVAYNPSPVGAGFDTDDVSVKDAYVALRAPVGNGIDFKVGTWTTICGYEVFESPNNPNYSRSYGWQLEPTQHTGVLANYKASEWLNIGGGVANTWNAGINARPVRAGGTVAESEKTYLGTVTLTAPESFGFLSGASLYGAIVDGLAGGPQDTTTYYAGVTLPLPIEGLSFGATYDYRDDSPIAGPAGDRAYAIAGYLSYQCTEKLKLNSRVDYTNADDGTWYASAAAGKAAGSHNELLSVTGTLDYALWANVLSRAEIRWDHALNGARPFAVADKNAITLAANIVYKF